MRVTARHTIGGTAAAGDSAEGSAREQPYIWATWVSRLLAGESLCEWAGWFRAHYQDWVKPLSGFDSAR